MAQEYNLCTIDMFSSASLDFITHVSSLLERFYHIFVRNLFNVNYILYSESMLYLNLHVPYHQQHWEAVWDQPHQGTLAVRCPAWSEGSRLPWAWWSPYDHLAGWTEDMTIDLVKVLPQHVQTISNCFNMNNYHDHTILQCNVNIFGLFVTSKVIITWTILTKLLISSKLSSYLWTPFLEYMSS